MLTEKELQLVEEFVEAMKDIAKAQTRIADHWTSPETWAALKWLADLPLQISESVDLLNGSVERVSDSVDRLDNSTKPH